MPDDVVLGSLHGRDAARHGITVMTGPASARHNMGDLARYGRLTFVAVAGNGTRQTLPVRPKQKYWKAKLCGGCGNLASYVIGCKGKIHCPRARHQLPEEGSPNKCECGEGVEHIRYGICKLIKQG